MAPHEDDNADQQIFNYINFNPVDFTGAQFPAFGHQTQLEDHELEHGVVNEACSLYYEPSPSTNHLDDPSIIPTLGRPQDGGYFVGLESGALAPGIQVHDPAGEPVYNFPQYFEGNSNEPQHRGLHQTPDATLISRSPGPLSQWTTSTPATDDSSFLPDSSTAPFTANTSHSNSRPSSSHHLPAQLKCDHVDCVGSAKVYDLQSTLNKHARKHKPYEQRPFQCAICRRRWLYKKDLKRHETTHLALEGYPYPCPNCCRRFQRMDHLRRHQDHGCPSSGNRASSGPSSHLRSTHDQSQPAMPVSLQAQSETSEGLAGYPCPPSAAGGLATPPPSNSRPSSNSTTRRALQEQPHDTPFWYDQQSSSYVVGSSPLASQVAPNENVPRSPQIPPLTPPPSTRRNLPMDMQSPLSRAFERDINDYPSPSLSHIQMKRPIQRRSRKGNNN